MSQLLLRTRNISKTRRRRLWRRGGQTLHYRDFEVRAGEIVALQGVNGVGKSTFLSICAGVLKADGGGDVVRAGVVGYCPQTPPLLDLLTVEEHLRYFCIAKGYPAGRGVQEAKALLARLSFRGVSGKPTVDIARDPVKNLSGGNRQKVNLVLALIGGPRILLLDEPDQGFDFRTKRIFWTELLPEWATRGMAVVVITHEEETAIREYGLGSSLRMFEPRPISDFA